MTRQELTEDASERNFSCDVRIWEIGVLERKKGKTYRVRWIVGGVEQHDTFATKPLADTFRSDLIKHQRKGVRFDKTTGLPEPMLKARRARHSFYSLSCKYVDAKWSGSAPKSRKSVAEVLACIAEPLVREAKASIGRGAIRAVMYGWVAVKPLRDTGNPPAKLEASIKWLESHTIDMSDFDDPERGPDLTRQCLEAIATKLDGTRAMRNTIARRRAVVYNLLDFAVEQRIISRNPIDHIKWTTPKKAAGLAKQTVPSFQQAEMLLEGVGEQGLAGRRLVAFFALMMLAALRPAEALAVRASWFVSLPDEGWGKVVLHRSTPRSGVAWSDTGRSREDRSLKHRAEEDTREVPLHPILVRIIRDHITEYRKQGNDRLFTGPRGGLVDESVYLPLWQRARLHALGPDLAATRLAWRPYDSRHFIISFWLLAGVSVTQVALWAGNSEAVIWEFYAKLMNGQEAAALGLVDRATQEHAKPELEKFSSDRSANVPQVPVDPRD